jgi:hypothetical protein
MNNTSAANLHPATDNATNIKAILAAAYLSAASIGLIIFAIVKF